MALVLKNYLPDCITVLSEVEGLSFRCDAQPALSEAEVFRGLIPARLILLWSGGATQHLQSLLFI